MKKILIFVTNHATLGSTNDANGTYAPELTHALDVFQKAKFDYDLVSIQGGEAPVYGKDIEDDAVNAKILADETFNSRIRNTLKATDINIDDYAAIFYPGGFGLLSDLATDATVATLSASHYEKGGLIGAVCHGPAGLLPITLSNGEKLLANKTVTGFTREEEVDYGTIENIPFLLEESLARSAKQYRKGQPWSELVVEDDRVITGQNPASAHAVAIAMVKHLN